MPKNIVICCDGTANKFGDVDTNIVKLCYTLVRDPKEQVLFYDPGVGTIGDQRMFTRIGKTITRVVGSAIGRGLSENLAEAYGFLCDNHEPSDRVFLFGFSRGAYTARVLAGMVHMYGLLGRGCGNLWPYLWGLYTKSKGDDNGKRFRVAADFKRTLGRPIDIDFLGVFDTVSSVGWFWDPAAYPYTALNPSVQCFRHAVALDERRAFFRQNLWSSDPKKRPADFKEVWFAGVHCDVGGGYPEPESGLSKIALEWMLREAEAHMMRVDPERRAEILGGNPKMVKPNPLADAHESLHGVWWLLEFLPRLRWDPVKRGRRLRWNLGKRRRIRLDSAPVVHESVKTRIAQGGYAPKNLPATYGVEV